MTQFGSFFQYTVQKQTLNVIKEDGTSSTAQTRPPYFVWPWGKTSHFCRTLWLQASHKGNHRNFDLSRTQRTTYCTIILKQLCVERNHTHSSIEQSWSTYCWYILILGIGPTTHHTRVCQSSLLLRPSLCVQILPCGVLLPGRIFEYWETRRTKLLQDSSCCYSDQNCNCFQLRSVAWINHQIIRQSPQAHHRMIINIHTDHYHIGTNFESENQEVKRL